MKKIIKTFIIIILVSAALYVAIIYNRVQHVPHMGENLCALSGCNGDICYDPLTKSGVNSNCMIPFYTPDTQCRLTYSKCARPSVFGACGWIPKDPATFSTDVEMCVQDLQQK